MFSGCCGLLVEEEVVEEKEEFMLELIEFCWLFVVVGELR